MVSRGVEPMKKKRKEYHSQVHDPLGHLLQSFWAAICRGIAEKKTIGNGEIIKKEKRLGRDISMKE